MVLSCVLFVTLPIPHRSLLRTPYTVSTLYPPGHNLKRKKTQKMFWLYQLNEERMHCIASPSSTVCSLCISTSAFFIHESKIQKYVYSNLTVKERSRRSLIVFAER